MELPRRTESLSEVPHSVLFQRHPFVPVQAKRRGELQLFPEYFQILKKYIFFSCNYLDVSDKFGGNFGSNSPHNYPNSFRHEFPDTAKNTEQEKVLSASCLHCTERGEMTCRIRKLPCSPA